MRTRDELKSKMPSIHGLNLTDALMGDRPMSLIASDPIPPSIKERVNWTSVGLDIPADITPEEWREVGNVVESVYKGLPWMIGDLINASKGEWGWGSIYEVAHIMFPRYTPETLKNIASVAANIKLSSRNDNLSFAHHRAVAGLSDAEQIKWLDDADKNKLTVGELRRKMAQRQLTDAQRERRAQVVDRKRYVTYFANVAKLAVSSKTITIDEYRAYEAQLGELLAELGRRVKQDDAARIPPARDDER